MTATGNRSLQGNESHMISEAILEGLQCSSPTWYITKTEIEENSPSRRDGIDLKKEMQFQRLYCSFLQDLGIKLKVPQLTIATAMVLCHRFYLRQSHAHNEWQTIAPASMFLACKVEETPRKLKDVVMVAYEAIYRRDPAACQRIKEKDGFEKQKEIVVSGERVLLGTVAYDLNIQHPYKPLVSAIKRLQISDHNISKVAWNFVNDWLCTTLCLQYKPHYIAAGALYLAAKLHKFKLPSEKGKVWWLQFDVTPTKLEEVLQHIAMLLEPQKKLAVPSHKKPAKIKAATQEIPAHQPLDSKSTEGHDIVNEQPQTGGSVVTCGDSSALNVPIKWLRPLFGCVATGDICAQSGTDTASVSCVLSEPAAAENLKNQSDQCKQGQVSLNTSDLRARSVNMTTPDSHALTTPLTTGTLYTPSAHIAASDLRPEIDMDMEMDISDDGKVEVPCPTSDCGSSHSVVEDGNRSNEAEGQVLGTIQSTQSVDCKIVAVPGGLSEIDKDRIRERLKKRKQVDDLKKVALANVKDEDSWIEKELESGIEVTPSAKKKKLV